jgi:tetrahydromethanopterin S-methyltransferase subunit B
MKIVETVELINKEKVVFGSKEIKLTLDTETGRLAIDTPAIFGESIVSLNTIEEKINKLKSHMER